MRTYRDTDGVLHVQPDPGEGYRDLEGIWHQAFAGHYDPSEARDDHGRWTGGGGAADSPAERAAVATGHAHEGALLQTLRARAGFTFSLLKQGRFVASGYAVSPYEDREAQFDRPVNRADLHTFIQRNRDLLAQPNHYLGAWYDPESKKTFLDVSIVHGEQADAEREARAHQQLAIYHLDTGDTLQIGNRERLQASERPAARPRRPDWRGRDGRGAGSAPGPPLRPGG